MDGHDTAFSRAFSDAGLRTAEQRNDDARQRLVELAIAAWARFPRPPDGQARRDHVASALVGEMSWAMIGMYRPSLRVEMLGYILNHAEAEIRAQRPKRDAWQPAGGGHKANDTQASGAPASTHAAPAADSGGHEWRDTQAKRAAAVSNLTIMANAHEKAMKAKAETEKKLSRLDTVMIDGIAIGDCTVAEVKAWADRRKTDARHASRDVLFALALVSGLPGGKTIRKWIKPEEADAFYQRAEGEAHAA